MDLEPFLKRFSAGHIYAKLLTKFCDKFKTKNNDSEILAVAQMLLAQNVFLQSKRGKWYEILSKAYESMKNNKLAAETLIEALKDPNVNEVQKLNLQLRGQAILKKKTGAIEDVYLRESLDDACTILVQEPPSIEIRGKALTGNKIGYKSVYIEESNDEKLYTSVEERALLHYKTNGFPKGINLQTFL